MKTILIGCVLISGLTFSQVNPANFSVDSSISKNHKKITALKIIENYLNATGGKKNLRKIIDRKIFLTGTIQNVKVKMIVYQKSPNKYYQKVSLGNTVQKTIFNGKKGFTIINENVTELFGSDLKKLKYEATMELLPLLNVYNVKADFTAEKIINGRKAYEIELSFPSGMKWTQFYDKETSLKIKELKPVAAPEDTIIQETYFDDYQEIEGIKYPFKIKQTLGVFNYEFTVDSIKINTGLSNRNFELEE